MDDDYLIKTNMVFNDSKKRKIDVQGVMSLYSRILKPARPFLEVNFVIRFQISIWLHPRTCDRCDKCLCARSKVKSSFAREHVIKVKSSFAREHIDDLGGKSAS